ncbi:MAG: nuclear transport factor 2 family protein [Knoellia sp.]
MTVGEMTSLMGRPAVETPVRMLDSLTQQDLAGVLDCFDPAEDTYVFVEGPRWTNRGGERIRDGWRDYFVAPQKLASWAWVEGPEVHESGDLALVAGVIRYDFEIDGASVPMKFRMTWVLRRAHGEWRILHEHGSQPLPDPYGTGDWLRPDTEILDS